MKLRLRITRRLLVLNRQHRRLCNCLLKFVFRLLRRSDEFRLEECFELLRFGDAGVGLERGGGEAEDSRTVVDRGTVVEIAKNGGEGVIRFGMVSSGGVGESVCR
jgi:hypothetical protein